MSKKLIPTSRAVRTICSAVAPSQRLPKLLHPIPSLDTGTPLKSVSETFMSHPLTPRLLLRDVCQVPVVHHGRGGKSAARRGVKVVGPQYGCDPADHPCLEPERTRGSMTGQVVLAETLAFAWGPEIVGGEMYRRKTRFVFAGDAGQRGCHLGDLVVYRARAVGIGDRAQPGVLLQDRGHRNMATGVERGVPAQQRFLRHAVAPAFTVDPESRWDEQPLVDVARAGKRAELSHVNDFVRAEPGARLGKPCGYAAPETEAYAEQAQPPAARQRDASYAVELARRLPDDRAAGCQQMRQQLPYEAD